MCLNCQLENSSMISYAYVTCFGNHCIYNISSLGDFQCYCLPPIMMSKFSKWRDFYDNYNNKVVHTYYSQKKVHDALLFEFVHVTNKNHTHKIIWAVHNQNNYILQSTFYYLDARFCQKHILHYSEQLDNCNIHRIIKTKFVPNFVSTSLLWVKASSQLACNGRYELETYRIMRAIPGTCIMY